MKKSDEAPKGAAKDTGTVTHSGVVHTGKIVTGKEPKNTPKEQGQLARGEIDEAGEPTGKETEAGDANEVKSGETLYQGWITGEATAAATGQQVSNRWNQAEATTLDGLFHSFLAYHPSAIRSTFKVDPTNKIDPTLRTYLEK